MKIGRIVIVMLLALIVWVAISQVEYVKFEKETGYTPWLQRGK